MIAEHVFDSIPRGERVIFYMPSFLRKHLCVLAVNAGTCSRNFNGEGQVQFLKLNWDKTSVLQSRQSRSVAMGKDNVNNIP